jgi:hypothetical protein
MTSRMMPKVSKKDNWMALLLISFFYSTIFIFLGSTPNGNVSIGRCSLAIRPSVDVQTFIGPDLMYSPVRSRSLTTGPNNNDRAPIIYVGMISHDYFKFETRLSQRSNIRIIYNIRGTDWVNEYYFNYSLFIHYYGSYPFNFHLLYRGVKNVYPAMKFKGRNLKRYQLWMEKIRMKRLDSKINVQTSSNSQDFSQLFSLDDIFCTSCTDSANSLHHHVPCKSTSPQSARKLSEQTTHTHEGDYRSSNGHLPSRRGILYGNTLCCLQRS